MSGTDTGVLDEALERLHRAGPERDGWLSNHAPMAVEALVRHGHGASAHRWLERYALTKLEDLPGSSHPVREAEWREALGDPRRLGDWTAHFGRAVVEEGWRPVLVRWWPRLLPGIVAGATHPVIRVGHAVRALLEYGENAARVTELAHGLAYWAG
ncbi:questin oxidase family protein, partial [Streptomyces sp. UH6]|uniref:questin oxidase family protein n=1 Tax=Streptomyces sp. UH6 TaxID=2748379 RepID=UPI0015D4A98B